MVARLQKIDTIASHQIDQPMLVGNAPRPASRQNVPQRFGLSDPGERLTQHGLHELQHPQSNLAIGFNPVAKVLAELGVENGLLGVGWGSFCSRRRAKIQLPPQRFDRLSGELLTLGT